MRSFGQTRLSIAYVSQSGLSGAALQPLVLLFAAPGLFLLQVTRTGTAGRRHRAAKRVRVAIPHTASLASGAVALP